MSIIHKSDPFVTSNVIDLVMRERSIALSNREWKHRLAGYGYSVRDTDLGQILETLFGHGKQIGRGAAEQEKTFQRFNAREEPEVARWVNVTESQGCVVHDRKVINVHKC